MDSCLREKEAVILTKEIGMLKREAETVYIINFGYLRMLPKASLNFRIKGNPSFSK